MAIVKVLFRKEAAQVIRYVFGHTQPGDPADSEYCPPNAEAATEEFRLVREQYKFKEGRNEAIHVIQSWNESDSNKLTPETVNGMGRKLVEDYFKGHQFVIVTHTETGKLHNHIVINTVNLETGKMAAKKYKHLHQLRRINDRICLERGLEVPHAEANQRKARIPQKVQQMVRAGRESWVWDAMNKADVARSLATSYDQYVDYLDALGVKARVEDKNITYFYPGKSRGKRGDKIGKGYDKPGLEQQFKINDERFQAKPEIRAQLLAAQKKGNSDLLKSLSESQGGPKDYSLYTKQPRRNPNPAPASERELTSQIISAEEFRRARRSIIDYCNESGIRLSQNSRGQTVLHGKDHVVIHGDEATNTKNGTRATLIDFVAAHHRLTLLQAVAKINGTSSPLLVEQHYGAVERKYTSFYIPKQDQMPHVQAVERLSQFLKAHRASPRVAETMIKHQRAEVSKSGTIRLFAESDPGGALEFKEGKDGSWHENKQGSFQRPFYKRAARTNRLIIFSNPKAYLSTQGHDALSERNHRDGVLVLMEPSAPLIENYLSENSGIRKVHIVAPKSQSLSKQSIDFFNVLKQKLAGKGIEFKVESPEKSFSLESQSMGL